MSEPGDVRESRDRAIAVLTTAFSRDHLELEELEVRLQKVHSANTAEEIRTLLADLPGQDRAMVPAPRTGLTVLAAEQVRAEETMVAILGGSERKGTWSCAAKTVSVNVFGGCQLDFREARMPAGVVELRVYAIMGGVEIIVPPELAVETEGIGIMGGFVQMDRAPPEVDPERPVLRISGVAVMGGVSVETRLPGENARDAKKRERLHRKALKKLNS